VQGFGGVRWVFACLTGFFLLFFLMFWTANFSAYFGVLAFFFFHAFLCGYSQDQQGPGADSLMFSSDLPFSLVSGWTFIESEA